MKIWQEDDYWYAQCDHGAIYTPYVDQKKKYGPKRFREMPQLVYSWSDESGNSDQIGGPKITVHTLFQAGKIRFMLYQTYHKFSWSKNKPWLIEEYFMKPIKPPRIPEIGPAYELRDMELVSIDNPKQIIRLDTFGDRAKNLLKDWQRRFESLQDKE